MWLIVVDGWKLSELVSFKHVYFSLVGLVGSWLEVECGGWLMVVPPLLKAKIDIEPRHTNICCPAIVALTQYL